MTKICTQCKIEKPYSEFYKDPRTKKDGLYGKCKTCHNSKTKSWGKRNPAKHRFWASRYAKSNPSKVNTKLKRYRLTPEGREKTRQWNKNYKNGNKPKVNAVNAAYRAGLKTATPPWLTKEMKLDIEFFYEIANSLPNHHVDHIHPLNGDNFNGLHVPWNLQVLPAVINISKGNRIKKDLLFNFSDSCVKLS